MRVLAVDTTSAHSSVAIVGDDGVLGVSGFRAPRPRHSENLLPAIHELLARVELSLQDLDAFCVARGPGSFSGLRIGIATMAGLGYAVDRPVIGFSALDATAHHYRHHQGVIAVLLEAYRSEVYGASYRSDGRRCLELGRAICAPAESFVRELSEAPSLVVGSGIARNRALIREVSADAVIAEPGMFLAEAVGRLGCDRLGEGDVDTSAELQALYIRAPEAERNRMGAAKES